MRIVDETIKEEEVTPRIRKISTNLVANQKEKVSIKAVIGYGFLFCVESVIYPALVGMFLAFICGYMSDSKMVYEITLGFGSILGGILTVFAFVFYAAKLKQNNRTKKFALRFSACSLLAVSLLYFIYYNLSIWSTPLLYNFLPLIIAKLIISSRYRDSRIKKHKIEKVTIDQDYNLKVAIGCGLLVFVSLLHIIISMVFIFVIPISNYVSEEIFIIIFVAVSLAVAIGTILIQNIIVSKINQNEKTKRYIFRFAAMFTLLFIVLAYVELKNIYVAIGLTVLSLILFLFGNRHSDSLNTK